jgi:predicted dehydrogenase
MVIDCHECCLLIDSHGVMPYMDTKYCLVVGRGSAGIRHETAFRNLGYSVSTVDTDENKNADYLSLGDALDEQDWDYFVIATPPSEHIEEITMIVFGQDSPSFILCEKPFCMPDELIAAEYLDTLLGSKHKMLMAYNYRYHPVVNAAKVAFLDLGCDTISLEAVQSRKLPPWGILADHISHDMDIIRYVTGADVSMIISASHASGNTEQISVTGTMGSTRFSITDRVEQTREVPRDVKLTIGYSDQRGDMVFSIGADPIMFGAMTDDFLSGSSHDGWDVIGTQKLLYRINGILGGYNDGN